MAKLFAKDLFTNLGLWITRIMVLVVLAGSFFVATIIMSRILDMDKGRISPYKTTAVACSLPSGHSFKLDKVRKQLPSSEGELYFENIDGSRVALYGNYTCIVQEEK